VGNKMVHNNILDGPKEPMLQPQAWGMQNEWGKLLISFVDSLFSLLLPLTLVLSLPYSSHLPLSWFLLLLSKLDTREITPLGSTQIEGFLIGLLPIDNDLIPVSYTQ
jgi:hypothetical protein